MSEIETKVAILETNLTNFMDKLETSIHDNKEAHDKLFALIEKMETKLDYAISQKADKIEVATLWKKYDGIMTWATRIGITALLGTLSFLAVELFKHLTQ